MKKPKLHNTGVQFHPPREYPAVFVWKDPPSTGGTMSERLTETELLHADLAALGAECHRARRVEEELFGKLRADTQLMLQANRQMAEAGLQIDALKARLAEHDGGVKRLYAASASADAEVDAFKAKLMVAQATVETLMEARTEKNAKLAALEALGDKLEESLSDPRIDSDEAYRRVIAWRKARGGK